MITNLSLDLETRSSADIGKCGVYKYAEDPDFDILLLGVSIDHGPVTVYDLACGLNNLQKLADGTPLGGHSRAEDDFADDDDDEDFLG